MTRELMSEGMAMAAMMAMIATTIINSMSVNARTDLYGPRLCACTRRSPVSDSLTRRSTRQRTAYELTRSAVPYS